MKVPSGAIKAMLGLSQDHAAADPPPRTEILAGPVPPGWTVVDADEGSIAPQGLAAPVLTRLRQQRIGLIAIRHGQSQSNAEGQAAGTRILCGQVESPLTTLGLQQAEEAAHSLYVRLGGDEWLTLAAQAPERLPILYSSPLSRAHDTAAACARYLHERATDLMQAGRLTDAEARLIGQALHPLLDPRLTEYGFGDYELSTVPDACRQMPTFMKNWDPLEGKGVDFVHRFPGGESRCDVLSRVDSFLEHVAARHAGRIVLMFCHMRTIAAALEEVGLMPVQDGRLREVTSHIGNATPIVLVDSFQWIP